MKAAAERKPFSLFVAGLVFLLSFGHCQQESIRITTYHFERGGDIEFVCFCENSSGRKEATAMDMCMPEEENDNCYPVAFVLQVNRDEIGIVDLRAEALVDSDVRVPFNTFNHTGRGPSDVAATGDGKKLLISHYGDHFVAVYNTEELFGDFLADFTIVPLPGPSSSIAMSGIDAGAYVTLPENSAIAVIDLTDLSADPEIHVFPVEIIPPEEESAEEVAEVVEESPEIPDAFEEMDVPSDFDEEGDGEDAGEVEVEVEDAMEDEDVAAEDMAAEDMAEEEDMEGEDGPEPEEDIGGEDPAADITDAGTDDADITVPGPFYPWHVMVRETETESLLVVAGSGSGGVMIFNASRIGEGLESAFIAGLLSGVAVKDVAITSSGDYLYGVDRDDGTVHAVDMTTGLEIDTTGGNPLVKQGAIELDGRANDVTILDLDFGDEVDPRTFRGTFAFIVASNGRVYVVDIDDLNCPDCPSHVLRNANDDESSAPFWRAQPSIFAEEAQVQYVEFPSGFPSPDRFDDTLPPSDAFMYGISFFPYDPWSDVEDEPDIRRAVTQQWKIVYEGALPSSGGIGGNVEEGGVFTDSGLPFCVVGVRDGDILVIDDAPSPVVDAECNYPDDGVEYRITQATMNELHIEPFENPDGNVYDLPTEECFPFAVRYHVHVKDHWVVVGGATGYLNDWGTDDFGRCVDKLPPCSSWEEEDCTLLHGRTVEDSFFVNPYIKFKLIAMRGGDSERISPKDKTEYIYQAASGFEPLSLSVARMPVNLNYMSWNNSLYISDAATEGLVELNLEEFFVTNKYF